MAAERIITIEQIWQRYAREVLPKNASRVQMVETRRAIFAGCHALLVALRDDIAELPELHALVVIQGLHDECQAFADDVERGSA